MLLTEQTLRVLVYNILLEGFMDDIVKLKARLKTGPAELAWKNHVVWRTEFCERLSEQRETKGERNVVN
jgi:hypothetical protein